MLVTLTRADATAKNLCEGASVWIKPVRGGSRVKIVGDTPPVAEELPIPLDAAAAVNTSLS